MVSPSNDLSFKITFDFFRLNKFINCERWGEIPIEKIEPETMEGFLDEFCLQSTKETKDISWWKMSSVLVTARTFSKKRA